MTPQKQKMQIEQGANAKCRSINFREIFGHFGVGQKKIVAENRPSKIDH